MSYHEQSHHHDPAKEEKCWGFNSHIFFVLNCIGFLEDSKCDDLIRSRMCGDVARMSVPKPPILRAAMNLIE